MTGNIYIYILVMASVTYLIRMIPITFIHKKISNRFVRSFLYYVPDVTLTAMTVPSILTSASSIISSAAGLITALVLAYKNKSLLLVAAGASLTVLLVEFIPGLPV